jgi:hypothetical protein
MGGPKIGLPELQGIVLLPVDAAGRSAFTQFQPDQPRLRSDLPSASRLILPEEKGALYRYRRSQLGKTEFGFFLVRPSGLASFVAAFPGAGPFGDLDPIPHPVAISAEGDAMLVATTQAGGGDLFEIGLETATVRALTPGMPPLEVLPQGLVLLQDWGVALTTRGPFRFVRGGGAPLSVPLHARSRGAVLGGNPRSPAPTPLAYFGNGISRSADGSTVAVIAGVSAAQAHVFTFGLSGPAVCVNDVAAPIADPGFGTDAGPLLALSPDGRRAAWKTFGLSGECYSRRVPGPATPPEFQITSDLHFADTLNDTGVIAFFDPDSVVVLVGEPNGAGGVENGDLYRADFPAGNGAPTFTNLTRTSGDLSAPFTTKGELETSDGIYQIPGQAGAVYFVDGSSGEGEVYRLNGATGALALVRDGVAELDFIERAGADFVLGILHDQPEQRELLRVPFEHALPAASLGILSSTSTFLSRAGNPSGLFAGALNVTGGQRILQVHVPTGAGALWQDVLTYGPVLGFDGSGAALTSVQAGSASHFVAWSLGSGSGSYGSGPLGSLVLPAN